MIISRREWEEMCDTNRKLLKDKEEKMDKIDYLEYELRSKEKDNAVLQAELDCKKEAIDILNTRLTTSSNNLDIVIKSNKKLAEWINKIINDVGIYEVKDPKSVTIPIYKKSVNTYSGNFEGLKEEMANLMNQETITIPEIRIVRTK